MFEQGERDGEPPRGARLIRQLIGWIALRTESGEGTHTVGLGTHQEALKTPMPLYLGQGWAGQEGLT